MASRLYHYGKEAMSVTAMSFERVSHMRMDDLRREAFTEAQIRQAQGRPGARIAALLRALATRLEAGEREMGPWREDFRRSAAGRT